MKKVLLLVLGFGMIVSCSKDECTEVVMAALQIQSKVVQQSYGRVGVTTIDLGGLTSDLQLTPADATNKVIYTTGDLNLNGFKLTLKNVRLNIVGNFNGGGVLKTQGAYGAYCMVNGGAIQNNPDLSNATNNCGTLSSGGGFGGAQIEVEVPCGTDTFTRNGLTYKVVR